MNAKIKCGLLSLVMVGALGSCSSLLDENPQYSQNSKVIYSSKINAELALLGCFQKMSEANGYGQMWQEVPVTSSGLARSAVNRATRTRLNALPSENSVLQMAWDGMYKVISEVNGFLEGLEQGSLSEEEKAPLRGEAKFLRALAYYNLASHFGDVPLKKVASTSEGIATPRSPQEEVLAFVVEDLKDAVQMAPAMPRDGRASSPSAKALLGKVYYKLAMLGFDKVANLQLAKQAFDEVYNSGVFALQPRFADLFGTFVKGSKEAIFQINFSTNDPTSRNRANFRFGAPNSTSGAGPWGHIEGSSTKLAYDIHEGSYPGDPRIDATFLSRWRTYRGGSPVPVRGDVLSHDDSTYTYPYITYTIPGDQLMKAGRPVKLKTHVVRLPYGSLSNPKNPSLSELQSWVTPTRNTPADRAIAREATSGKLVEGNNQGMIWPYFKKVWDQGQIVQHTQKNLMVYRYAEMLLHMADVYNELGDTQRAISLANEVLTRARNSRAGATQPASWSSSLTQGEVREKLYFERIIEFAGESVMYEMPRIRGAEFFKMLLEMHNAHELTAENARRMLATNAGHNFRDFIYNEGAGITDDFVRRNLLLPIPDSEVSNNAAITDNNFGY